MKKYSIQLLNLQNKKWLLIFLLLSSIILAACDKQHVEEQKLMKKSEDELYNLALNEARRNDISAIIKLDILEQQYPKSKYVHDAYLLRIYIYYKNEKFDEASIVADRYIKLYPNHSEVSYVKYIKALCYYDQLVDPGRDQKMTENTMLALIDVIEEYPETEYAKDAKWKYDYCINLLAAKEMEIGRFYVKRKDLIAAINRFKTVIDLYETTIFTPEALYRLVELYKMLGIVSEAEVYGAVLAKNYENSKWHIKAYNILHDHKNKTPIKNPK